MKVLALVILAFGYASARGSGPYLPSGWRPDGPAFFLPSEVKPAENPLKDVILQGSEASGSDALREYGPPKVVEVSQDLIHQALPDEVTEQQFDIISVNTGEIAEVNAEVVSPIVEVITEAQENPSTVTEAIPIVVFEPTTESVATTNSVAEVQSEISVDSDSSANSLSLSQELVQSEVTTESIAATIETKVESEQFVQEVQKAEEVQTELQKVEEVLIQEVQKVEEVQAEVQKVEEVLVQEVQQVEQEVQKVESVVQNIPDALAYLENGIKQVELAQAQVDAAVLENSGSLPEAPEGFLEYGPPGFREYGPPKDDLTKISSEGLSVGEAFESTNEARRRRFSPKFRSTKLH